MRTLVFALLRVPQNTLIFLVETYRLCLSPWLGSACRFEPSCSAYSLLALHRHGAVMGGWLTLRRLARCQPWCQGGHDPVPSARPTSFFSRLLVPAARISSEKTPS